MLAEGQFHALESMLTDSDCETFKLLVPELKKNRARYEDIVRRLAQSDNSCVRRTSQEILAEWENKPLPEAGETIKRLLHTLDEWSDLEELCWNLSKSECPCLCIDKAKRRLDLLAEKVEEKLKGEKNPESVLRAMSCIIGHKENFVGNIEDYYNPANGCLDRVLEMHKGIPLTLTLVYIFTGNRLGFQLYGLNTPGHYLGRYEDFVFDAFNRGIIVPPQQLAVRFKTEEDCWTCQDYCRATPFGTARRMLRNFQQSFTCLGDECRLAQIESYLEIMESIQPEC